MKSNPLTRLTLKQLQAVAIAAPATSPLVAAEIRRRQAKRHTRYELALAQTGATWIMHAAKTRAFGR